MPDKEILSSRLEAEAMRRIKEVIRARGGAQMVSDVTGIPLGTLNKNLAGQTKASFSTIMAILEQMQIEPALVFPSLSQPRKLSDIQRQSSEDFHDPKKRIRAMGQGEMSQDRRLSGQVQMMGDHTDSGQAGMIRLPVYSEVHASAGPGTVPASELADGVIAFDRRFLRDQGAAPEHCAVIWARGDSMMPTIPDGSALVVDRSQVEVADGCIMVLNVAGSLLVKRVQRLTSGEIRLISDNRDYEPEVLAQHQLEQLRVIGRVVYFGRTP